MEDPDNLIRDAFDEADLQKCPHCATLDEEDLPHLCEEK
jgi:recombinational DNA repair protein RecR